MPRSEQDAIQAAREIQTITRMPGWAHIVGRLEARKVEISEGLIQTMLKKPESLTGRKAMIEAGGLREIRDLLEWIEKEVKRV